MKLDFTHTFLIDVVLIVSKATTDSHHFPTFFFLRSTSLFASADVPMAVVHQQLTGRPNTPSPSRRALAQRAQRVKERVGRDSARVEV
jgi:hypothetical protein